MTADGKYRVVPGPEGLLPPSAMVMNVVLPEDGQGLLLGEIKSENETLEEMARQLLTRKNPTIFPGPLVVWAWDNHTADKAKAVLELAAEIPGVRIIPMPDYRPIYPKIDPEAVINPCHPNLTIWHNKIEVCVFVGLHCHYANITLKMIRAGTNCYTITLCAEAGHEDSMASLPVCGIEKIRKLTDAVRKVKREGLRPLYADTPGIRFTEAQKAVAEGRSWTAEHLAPPISSSEIAGELVHGIDANEE
jgi:hypothetical protein